VNKVKSRACGLLSLAGTCIGLSSVVAVALAQDAQPPNAAAENGPRRTVAEPAELQEVVVTGYRKSLTESTEAKRDAIGFIDQVNAEDIGKFPDTNIAESFNRIPGITITRDIDGEGTDISIRGLGTNFTKVLLNGAPVAVASTGVTDAQNSNREVDLDLFPTELFTQLTVKKTSSADMIEGGAAGTVDMRSARPFDNPGAHLTYTATGTKNQGASWGERGALIASDTWENGFGVLVGVAGVANRIDVKGFETIGWTNANLSAAQCGTGNTCNQTGGGNWTIPGTVPANAGNGLVTGATIDNAFLLAHNPGLTTQQIDNALIPRLGRGSDEFGARDRGNAVISLEYHLSDNLHAYVDSIYGHKKNNEQRIDMDWVGRNGSAIPLNMTVDQSNCSNGCVATGGTFANSQFFLEYRPYIETVNFYGVNPGLTWQLSDAFKMDVEANKTNSTFHRESPSVLVSTPLGDGLTVNYANSGGVPSLQSNVDLNNPANFGWNAGSRVNIQDEKRDTDTKGVRANFTWGKGKDVNLRFGAAYDDILRQIRAYDNSQAWQNAVCGDNPNIFVPTPNAQPTCAGLVQTGMPTAGYPSYPAYPGYGTLSTAGQTGAVAYQGSLVPNGAVPSYLRPGPAGFVTLNWPAFGNATNYPGFHNSEPSTTAANTGANGGLIEEKDTGFYLELTGDTTAWTGNHLRYTAGARYVRTNQTVGGYVSVPDNRNPANPPKGENPSDGGLFPNTVNFVFSQQTYHNILPSAEVAYNLTDQTILRLAGSRTMTRPDPSALLPGLGFSTPSADVGTVGNPNLKPFLSDNFDLGLEYYTGQEGYVSGTFFRKRLTGFTANGNTTVPFSALAPFGVTYATLSPAQQQAITARGGPDVATVVLQEQINASGALTVNGVEFNWVQPLDFLLARFGLDGFGFTANYTLVDQFGTGAAPAVALGVAPHTYNITAYYEHGPVMARLSTVYNKGSQISTLNQNGITNAALFSSDYRQYDFSSSLDLSKLFGWSHEVQVTADALNLFDAKLRTYFQFSDATFTQYSPGRELMIGIRGKF
jgi:TonB-dependent receptor